MINIEKNDLTPSGPHYKLLDKGKERGERAYRLQKVRSRDGEREIQTEGRERRGRWKEKERGGGKNEKERKERMRKREGKKKRGWERTARDENRDTDVNKGKFGVRQGDWNIG